MRIVITEELYNELADKYCIEKSTSHRTEKVRKLVQVQKKKGGYYQAYRWVKVMDGKASRIDKKYNPIDARAKIQYNQKHIVSKDFRDLTPEEVKDFINRAKNEYYYYNRDGVHIAYGNDLYKKEKDKEKFYKELNDCRILASYGHEVFWLPEYYAYSDKEHRNMTHGDTITDNEPLEFKNIKKKVKDNYKKANEQAFNVFLSISDDISENDAAEQIQDYIVKYNEAKIKEEEKKKLGKPYKDIKEKDFRGKVYLYFENKKILRLYEYDNNGNFKELSAKK